MTTHTRLNTLLCTATDLGHGGTVPVGHLLGQGSRTVSARLQPG